MKGNAPNSDLLAKSRGPSVTRRRPDGGIIDELKRVDELNSALAGYTVPTALTLKALKNQSFQAAELLEGAPQRTFASKMYEKDRVMFMSKQIGKKKPIFKNYQQNNTFILRKEAQEKKRDQLRAAEEIESQYLDRLSSKVSGYSVSTKTKAFTNTTDPVSAIEKLMRTTNKGGNKRTLKI